MNITLDFDIVVIGAGPAGLSFANALSGHGLSIALLEKQSSDDVINPKFDGREIALTQNSIRLMHDYGIWQKIDDAFKAPLKEAIIYDGKSKKSLNISHDLTNLDELGWLVSNHHIKKNSYDALCEKKSLNKDVDIFFNECVVHISTNIDRSIVALQSGKKLSGKLIVAADSRFSNARNSVGIPSDMHNFGKTMLVCMMTHKNNHENKAWEWFDYERTLALLPMNLDPASQSYRSSVVITQSENEINELINLSETDFNLAVEDFFGGRLGKMYLASERKSYPLISVYPKRLVDERFAVIGDAAVGMHPVTAHGFNFGLLSVDYLSSEIINAVRSGSDIANFQMLLRYEKKHRRSTKPLYLITKLVTDIYTNNAAPVKFARKVILKIGRGLLPFRKAIAINLTNMR